MPSKSAGKSEGERWSHDVTEHSNALDLEKGVFALKDPREIAASLKRSAEASKRRKADPFRSAMSMLVFYINRAGKAEATTIAPGSNRPRTSCVRLSASRLAKVSDIGTPQYPIVNTTLNCIWSIYSHADTLFEANGGEFA